MKSGLIRVLGFISLIFLSVYSVAFAQEQKCESFEEVRDTVLKGATIAYPWRLDRIGEDATYFVRAFNDYTFDFRGPDNLIPETYTALVIQDKEDEVYVGFFKEGCLKEYMRMSKGLLYKILDEAKALRQGQK